MARVRVVRDEGDVEQREAGGVAAGDDCHQHEARVRRAEARG